MTGGIASAADTLERHIREGGTEGGRRKDVRFYARKRRVPLCCVGGFGKAFSDAACVKVSFDIGPL